MGLLFQHSGLSCERTQPSPLLHLPTDQSRQSSLATVAASRSAFSAFFSALVRRCLSGRLDPGCLAGAEVDLWAAVAAATPWCLDQWPTPLHLLQGLFFFASGIFCHFL